MYLQLFKEIPPEEIITEILQQYGISKLNEEFTMHDLSKMNIVDKITNMKPILSKYYINCKYKLFLNNITDKKCLTILRHFLRIKNCSLKSKEKHSGMSYQVIKPIEKVYEKSPFIVNFD